MLPGGTESDAKNLRIVVVPATEQEEAAVQVLLVVGKYNDRFLLVSILRRKGQFE